MIKKNRVEDASLHLGLMDAKRKCNPTKLHTAARDVWLSNKILQADL